ncbi:MAG: sensor histidine kinase [Candidatus Dormibacteraeota bacterium]|nr:sensor histidine kinase [Candidatus Dormibacteraeota bacterium]
MPLTRRWIKLGRLFMVAWLSFFFFPLGVIIPGHFTFAEKVMTTGALVAIALIWIWFWTRIVGDGPDRRFVWVAVVLNFILTVVFTLMTPPKYGSLFVYAVVMVGAAFPWRLAIPVVAGVAVSASIVDLIRGVDTVQAIGDGLINDAIVGLSVVAGHLLLEANRQLSLAREQIARLAVGEERLRFARDLHDLLGHSLSVIALKSELAGRLIKRSPAMAEHEIEDIEKVAREALREVREVVAGYRQPTLAAELAGAREALTAAGIDCLVEQDCAALPPAVEAVLAWTVREGATNVMRHSKARRCSIRLSQKDGQATVEVVDDGRGGTPEAGSGLRGLEERVRARGGELSAEPLPHEGFRLRVRLPLAQVTAPADRVTA